LDFFSIESIIFIACIIVTGFLTAAEVALSSFGEKKIEDLKEKGDILWQKFSEVHKNPEPYYGTVHLLSVTFFISSVVIGFLLSAKLINPDIVEPHIGFYDKPESIVISFLLTIFSITSVITVFSYLIPKALGFKYADKLGRFFIKFIIPLSKLFILPAKLLNLVSNFLLMPFNEKTNYSQQKLSEDEILDIISDGVKSGALNEKGEKIIKNIIEFTDLTAGEVMIPRTEMVAIDVNESNQKAVNEIILKGHTLIPVYEDSLDKIVGILHSKDVVRSLLESNQIPINKLMRPTYFIPENKLISEVLTEMQKKGQRLAIVTNEYGGVEGVITIEDILHEIVGEIRSEPITVQKIFYKTPDNKFLIPGSMLIPYFNKTFNKKLPESDEYTTVAGFVAERSGRILNLNEEVEFEGMKFELVKKTRQKMVQFKIYSDVVVFKDESSNNI
jgi:CBS domain containing-hemolysin-like protein